MTGFDWLVGAWKFVVSLGLLVLALARMPAARRVRVAAWLVLADLAFGVVKIVGYDESEFWLFLVMTLLLLALLLVARRRSRTT